MGEMGEEDRERWEKKIEMGEEDRELGSSPQFSPESTTEHLSFTQWPHTVTTHCHTLSN